MTKVDDSTRTEQIKTAIASIIGISSKSWTSVKDYPLSVICEEAKLDKNWTAATIAALKDNGLFEVEGKASGMRYKFNGSIMQDPDFIVSDVRKQYKILIDKYSKKSDLSPFKQNTTPKEISSKPKISKCKDHFDIDQICFILHNGRIKEAEVIGVDKSSGTYLHTIRFEGYPATLEVPIKDIYASAESLLMYLKYNVVKLPKP